MQLLYNDLYSDGNLVGYYRFESDLTATVGSPTGTGANITYVDGKYTKSASFNGSSSSVSLGNNYNLGSGDFSISIWAYVDSTLSGAGTVLGKTSTAGSEESYYITSSIVGGAAGFATRLHKANEDIVSLSSGNNYTADAWHHLVWTNDANGSQYLYVDGAAVIDGTGLAVGNNTSTFYLGRIDNATPEWFKGYLDDYSFFNRVLSANEVASLYGEPRSIGVLIF